MLKLASAPPVIASEFERTLVRVYDTIALRPFCASGPLDFVRIQGPLTCFTG